MEAQNDSHYTAEYSKEDSSAENNNPSQSLNFNIECQDIPVNFRRFPLDFRACLHDLFGDFSTALKHEINIQANTKVCS